MRGKLLFVVGIGAGYVLGSRAGRARYEQIKSATDKVWSSQPVQAGVGQVRKFANQRVDAVSAKAADKIRATLGSALGVNKTSKPSSVQYPTATASSASVRVGSTAPGTPPVSPTTVD